MLLVHNTNYAKHAELSVCVCVRLCWNTAAVWFCHFTHIVVVIETLDKPTWCIDLHHDLQSRCCNFPSKAPSNPLSTWGPCTELHYFPNRILLTMSVPSQLSGARSFASFSFTLVATFPSFSSFPSFPSFPSFSLGLEAEGSTNVAISLMYPFNKRETKRKTADLNRVWYMSRGLYITDVETTLMWHAH